MKAHVESAVPPPGASARPPSDAAQPARPTTNAVQMAAATLLKLEGDLRQAKTIAELGYFIANEPRVVTRAQQIVVLARARNGRLHVKAVSAVAVVDRSSSLVVWFESLIARLEREHGLDDVREFDAGAFSSAGDAIAGGYPLRNLLWTPFLDANGKVFGGMLQARAMPWGEHEIAIGRRFAGAAAHAWLALERRRGGRGPAISITRRSVSLLAVAAAALLFVPVPMSALAPVEVAPRNAFIVTAGIDGVVEDVLVQPNATVTKGQPLLRMADVVLRNRLEIAEREVILAEARLKKSAQLAFVDIRGRHELGLAEAELELKLAEREYARQVLSRSIVRAERDGVALYSDKKDLIGRPVATGEKLMEIADPRASELRIDLPVAEAIVLRGGERIKVFLDANPLHPIEARLLRADYRARPRDNQQLAFRLIAETVGPDTESLRLGVRGTAKILSGDVPLGFYLFRRPISAARQWIGY